MGTNVARRQRVRTLVSVAVMVAVMGCPWRGAHGRPKSAWCRSNLRAWYEAELAYKEKTGAYTPLVLEVGFAPEGGDPYAYFADRTGPLLDETTRGLRLSGPATGYTVSRGRSVRREQALDLRRVGCEWRGGRCEAMTAVCAADMSPNPQLDIWSISTRPRRMPDGTVLDQGDPFHEVDEFAKGD